MKKESFLALWGIMFIVCAGLGFIPEPDGFGRWLLTALSLLFFLPPAALLWDAGKKGDRDTAKLVRNLAAASLALTLAALVLTFLTALRWEVLGSILSFALIVVSAPMVCCGNWALSLFLWACLLMAGIRGAKGT